MKKAHLYEALYLVNHGIDEAVSGVLRLKKSPGLFMETYHKAMTGLERRRSMINLQFMLEVQRREELDESYFAEEYNHWLADDPLDNDQIYKLVRIVEQDRKLAGKPPLVQFLRPKKEKDSGAEMLKALKKKTKSGGRSSAGQAGNERAAA